VHESDVDGISIDSRKMSGSSFDELRLTAKSSRSPENLCTAVWGEGEMKTKEPGFKLRHVLRQSENERWTYEQIEVPVAKDRDYTMHTRRARDPATHLCEVIFDTRNQDGPPPNPNFVRIPRISGSWTIEPNDGSGSVVTYVLFSDPGGNIPAWMARGGQKSNAVKWMKTILSRPDLRASAK
jgi:hypothetical protein